MKAHEDDLTYCQAAGVMAEIWTLSGQHLIKEVHEVNPDGGFVSLIRGEMLGDRVTTMKLALDLIESVTVTDSPIPET